MKNRFLNALLSDLTENDIRYSVFLFVRRITRVFFGRSVGCNDFFCRYPSQIHPRHHKLDSKLLDDQLPIQDRFAFPAARKILFCPWRAVERSRTRVLCRNLVTIERVKVILIFRESFGAKTRLRVLSGGCTAIFGLAYLPLKKRYSKTKMAPLRST